MFEILEILKSMGVSVIATSQYIIIYNMFICYLKHHHIKATCHQPFQEQSLLHEMVNMTPLDYIHTHVYFITTSPSLFKPSVALMIYYYIYNLTNSPTTSSKSNIPEYIYIYIYIYNIIKYFHMPSTPYCISTKFTFFKRPHSFMNIKKKQIKS